MELVNPLPEIEKIKGLVLRPRKGQSAPVRIFLQYQEKAGEWHETSMSIADGLYLLGLLEQMKSDLERRR